ncbi:MAG: hypothetical protein ABSG76_23620 [Xanthobacteraceae bacterium]
MSRYRRAKIEGGVYFFTVVLADRSSDLLVREIDRLRRIYVARGVLPADWGGDVNEISGPLGE